MRNSESYAFTVTDLNAPGIAAAKWMAKVANAKRRVEELQNSAQNIVRQRVVIRPRLGKNNPHRHLYAVGGPLKRLSSQDIKREHGARFDVYVREIQIWK